MAALQVDAAVAPTQLVVVLAPKETGEANEHHWLEPENRGTGILPQIRGKRTAGFRVRA